MGNPATIRAAPSTRAIGNSGGAKCQCVRYQGTYTASVPGAMTRKIAEPMIAAARCTIGAYSTPPRIVRIGRALASRDVLREVLVAFEPAIEVARDHRLATGVAIKAAAGDRLVLAVGCCYDRRLSRAMTRDVAFRTAQTVFASRASTSRWTSSRLVSFSNSCRAPV